MFRRKNKHILSHQPDTTVRHIPLRSFFRATDTFEDAVKNVAREARVGEVGAHNLQNLNLGVRLRLSIHIAFCVQQWRTHS